MKALGRIRTVREVLVLRFQLEAELLHPPSASGGQLEALRSGLVQFSPGDDWRRSHSAERRQLAYAEVLRLTRDLSLLELEVCRLRYWTPLDGHDEGLRLVRESDLFLTRVGERAERWRRAGEPAGEVPLLPVMATRAGDELVRYGQVGWAYVREVRARLTSFATIARELGISERQAQRCFDRARERVTLRLIEARIPASFSPPPISDGACRFLKKGA